MKMLLSTSLEGISVKAFRAINNPLVKTDIILAIKKFFLELGEVMCAKSGWFTVVYKAVG